MGRAREKGATMIEFAIILPLLLLVLAGMLDLGRMFLAQAMVTNGAREGVRMAAFNLPGDVTARADAAMPGLNAMTNGGSHSVVIVVACPASPGPTSAASVRVRITGFNWFALGGVSSLFGASIAPPQPTATSSMRCSG